LSSTKFESTAENNLSIRKYRIIVLITGVIIRAIWGRLNTSTPLDFLLNGGRSLNMPLDNI